MLVNAALNIMISTLTVTFCVWQDSHLSDACGVKLSSWKSVIYVHSSKLHGNLLTYLICLLERHDKNALAFLKEFATLKTATQ